LVKKDNHSGGIHIFETRDEALEWMENQILQEQGWIAPHEQQQALALEQIELLRKIDEQTLAALQHCIHEQSVKAGEKIFALGDSGDDIFLIRRGVVQIFLPLKSGKHHHLVTFYRGDYFGEMAFLDHHQRSADAVAKTDCDLYRLSRAEFNAQVYNNSIMGVRIFARMARAISLRLRQTDIELSALEER
jgi:SulP family sulfate permease